MRLNDIRAVAHPTGNRIDLSWINPAPGAFPGVRVVRREGAHPRHPDDGVLVAHRTGLLSASDTGLKGETVYYYSLFPFHGELSNPPQYEDDPDNRASATATSPYDFGGRMFDLLPALYHRYDAIRSPGSRNDLAPVDQDKGPLRRFLDLPGAEFDAIYSRARSALNLHDLDQVPGSLLPLLAQWIGWRTDYGLPVDAQRNEIRFAPHIYQTTGLIPTIEATVKRITGWESRAKEFFHNVARTNRPEQLNLWSMMRDASGNLAPPTLASLDFVYSGRPAAVVESDSTISLFYHAGQLWTGAAEPQAASLPAQASPQNSRLIWGLRTKRFADAGWQESVPIGGQTGLDKNPAAARQGNKLWVYWESYEPADADADRKWRIHFRTRETLASGAGSPPKFAWSSIDVFGDRTISRRLPAAVADNAGGVWLFWLEEARGGWRLRYNLNGGAAIDFPLDAGQDPRVEADLFAFFHPTSAGQRLWLFWARQEAGNAAGQSRWAIFYRSKQGLDAAVTNDWSPVQALPRAADNHDREPCAVVTADGNIELFWSSSRDGGWTLWNGILEVGSLTVNAPHEVVATAYSNRAPLAVPLPAGGTLIAYRSNESVAYPSTVYAATRTLDARYAGTTTVDTRNTRKRELKGKFEDFQAYIQDSGTNGARTDDDRVARDTIGIFLMPDTADPNRIKAIKNQLANVLAEFMPISERAVLIPPEA